MTSETRKAVRANGDLPPAARLLFEEIWEMHHASEDGCYADDEYLSNQIGAAESSVRRYRKQLRQAGYITEQKSGGRRRLVPTEVISTDQNDHFCTSNTDQSDQNCTDDDQSCTEEVISSDQHISSSNPEGTRESAPARETGADKAVRIFAEELRLPRELYDEATEIKSHTDWDPEKLNVWRDQCIDTRRDMRDPSRAKLSILLNDFDEAWARKREDTRSIMEKMPGPPYNAN